jgi:LPS sulfotransferase NodH
VFVPLLGRCSNTDNVLLVPQAPPYTEEEAWTMYFKAEDAAWEARFAKEDVEYLKYSSEFLRRELREANDRWIKASNEEDRLRMEIEKLRKEAEKLESELEEEKRLNRKSSLRNKNMK